MRRPILSSEKGFGLVVVLAATLAVGSLGTYALRDMSRTVREAGIARDELKAYLLARSGVEWVRSVPLESSEEEKDAFWELWSDIKRREFRGGAISVKVIDESARLNLSTLLDGADQESKEVLRRLLKSVGLPEISQAAIRSNAPLEKGDESNPSKPAERATYLTVGEVTHLVGTASAWRQLAPHVTVLSDGKVNVNRAGREVLTALFPERGEAAATAIMSGRSMKPFSSTAELAESLNKSGVTPTGGTRSRITTRSETVTVWSVGEFANHRQVVVAALRWQKGTWGIISFRTSGRFRRLEDVVEGF